VFYSPSGLLTPHQPSSLIAPCRSRRPSARLCLCWIYYICRDGTPQLSTTSVRRSTTDGPLALKISLGEMMSYLPIAGGHITMAERYVSKGFSFLLGWNYWYNWTIILPAELRFVRTPCLVLPSPVLLTSVAPQRCRHSHRVLEQRDQPRGMDLGMYGRGNPHQHAWRRYVLCIRSMGSPCMLIKLF